MNYKAKDFFALDEESVYSPSSPSSMSEGEEEEQVASQLQSQPQPQSSDIIVVVSSDEEGECSSPTYGRVKEEALVCDILLHASDDEEIPASQPVKRVLPQLALPQAYSLAADVGVVKNEGTNVRGDDGRGGMDDPIDVLDSSEEEERALHDCVKKMKVTKKSWVRYPSP